MELPTMARNMPPKLVLTAAIAVSMAPSPSKSRKYCAA